MSSMTGSRGTSGSNIPRGYAAGSLQQFTPQQLDLFRSLFSQVSPGSKLSSLAAGDESAFAPIEQQAMRGFQEFQGDLASRFTGMGLGARRGSGFKNLATQGAQDFATQLSSQRQNLQRQALADLLGISEFLLGQRPEEKFLVQKQQKPSRFGQILSAGLPIAGAVTGGIFGGAPGAALGGQLGSSIASGFNRTQY